MMVKVREEKRRWVGVVVVQVAREPGNGARLDCAIT